MAKKPATESTRAQGGQEKPNPSKGDLPLHQVSQHAHNGDLGLISTPGQEPRF